MSDKVLERYGVERPEDRRASGAGRRVLERPDGEDVEDFSSFGWLRGVRDWARMLELRKRNGNIMAVGYWTIERVEFDPSEGITLHAAGRKVTIKGRNLNAEVRPGLRLLEGICRHRVQWLKEADGPLRMEAEATVVEAIEW